MDVAQFLRLPNGSEYDYYTADIDKKKQKNAGINESTCTRSKSNNNASVPFGSLPSIVAYQLNSELR